MNKHKKWDTSSPIPNIYLFEATIETLEICSANQLTGFSMRVSLVFNGLKKL